MAIAEVISSSAIVVLVPRDDSEPLWKKSCFYLWDNRRGEVLDSVDMGGAPVVAVATRSEYVLAATANKACLYSTDMAQVLQTFTFRSSGASPFVAMTAEPVPFAAMFPTPTTTTTTTTPISKCSAVLCTVANSDSDSGDVVLDPMQEERASFAAFSQDGSLVAVAAGSGTIIAVYDTATKGLRAHFKRGRSTAAITGAAFSTDNTLLAVTSSHGSLHVYGLTGTVNNTVEKPGVVTSPLTLPCPQTQVAVAFADGSEKLVVVSSGGAWIAYALTVADGKVMAKISVRGDSLPQDPNK